MSQKWKKKKNSEKYVWSCDFTAKMCKKCVKCVMVILINETDAEHWVSLPPSVPSNKILKCYMLETEVYHIKGLLRLEPSLIIFVKTCNEFEKCVNLQAQPRTLYHNQLYKENCLQFKETKYKSACDKILYNVLLMRISSKRTATSKKSKNRR